MRRQRLLVVLCAAAVGMAAQERVDLTTPVAKASTSSYQLSSVTFAIDAAVIRIVLKANNGDELTKTYEGAPATTLTNALNTANLSTRSLKQRIFDRLISDGVLVGTVAGSVP